MSNVKLCVGCNNNYQDFDVIKTFSDIKKKEEEEKEKRKNDKKIIVWSLFLKTTMEIGEKDFDPEIYVLLSNTFNETKHK